MLKVIKDAFYKGMTITWLYRQYPFLLARITVAAIRSAIIKKTKRRKGIIQYFGEDVGNSKIKVNIIDVYFFDKHIVNYDICRNIYT